MGDYLAVNVIQEASSVFPTVDVADCVFISVVAADKCLSPIALFDLAEDNVALLDIFILADRRISATLATTRVLFRVALSSMESLSR